MMTITCSHGFGAADNNPPAGGIPVIEMEAELVVVIVVMIMVMVVLMLMKWWWCCWLWEQWSRNKGCHWCDFFEYFPFSSAQSFFHSFSCILIVMRIMTMGEDCDDFFFAFLSVILLRMMIMALVVYYRLWSCQSNFSFQSFHAEVHQYKSRIEEFNNLTQVMFYSQLDQGASGFS